MGGPRSEVRGPTDRLRTVSGVCDARLPASRNPPLRPPSLIVIRGNSGSGKSTTALVLRKTAGRGVALVQQDVIRRDLLRERDRPGALNIELIKLNVQFALAHDYDVILEGILFADRYGAMIRTLLAEHGGPTFVYYDDLPFEETLRRHASKPNSHAYGEGEMAGWFVERDLLDVPEEEIIGPDQSQPGTEGRARRVFGSGILCQGEQPVEFVVAAGEQGGVRGQLPQRWLHAPGCGMEVDSTAHIPRLYQIARGARHR